MEVVSDVDNLNDIVCSTNDTFTEMFGHRAMLAGQNSKYIQFLYL